MDFLQAVSTLYRCESIGRTIQKIVVLPRKTGFAIHQDLTVRVLGGYSLLVLAR